MKNIIIITEDGEQLISSTDDGTNQLIINDTVIPSADWVGTGTYTATIQGHAITITKAPVSTGNIQPNRQDASRIHHLKYQGPYLSPELPPLHQSMQ